MGVRLFCIAVPKQGLVFLKNRNSPFFEMKGPKKPLNLGLRLLIRRQQGASGFSKRSPHYKQNPCLSRGLFYKRVSFSGVCSQFFGRQCMAAAASRQFTV